MGSQAVWNALVEAPAAIVVETGEGWVIAEKRDADQPDRAHGGIGPVVLVYKQAPGLPYRTRREAATDAALILKRVEV